MAKKAKIEKEIKKNIFSYNIFKKKIFLINELKYLKKKYKISLQLPKILLKNKKQLNKYLLNKLIKGEKLYCWNTSKSRSIFIFFGLCRNIIKKFAGCKYLPGIIKSSW